MLAITIFAFNFRPEALITAVIPDGGRDMTASRYNTLNANKS